MRKTVIPAAIVILVLALMPIASHAQGASWFNSSWQYRNPITVSNSSGSTLSNFQVKVTLSSPFDFTKAKSDGSDIRVTASDGATSIPFWLESWNATSQAGSVWIQVPSIPTTGTTVYIYYGNSAATSASNGNATFLFFDDFETPSQASGYWTLGSLQTVMSQDQAWETSAPHTLSVAALNRNGVTYWGYYGLQNSCAGVGLAFSNDLINWTKFNWNATQTNPVITNARWPRVVQVGDTLYMVYEGNYCNGSSEVDLSSSTDGINWTFVKTLVPQNYMFNPRNQNPDLWLNPNDGNYYLYWYSGNDQNNFNIMVRNASSPTGLDSNTSEVKIMASQATLAAPDMMYYNGTYYLSTETLDINGLWNVQVFSSTTGPSSGFIPLPGNPVMNNGAACMFQTIIGTTLHEYYCQLTGSTWTINHQQVNLTQTRPTYSVPDTTKWTASGGLWSWKSDTQQDGTTGHVAQGATNYPEIFESTFSGTDYVLEAYAKQVSGRVWGLGFRVNNASNMYTTNLYDDLGGTQNLYSYGWVNGNSATLGTAAVGQVNANSWYKLSVHAHGNLFDIYKDDVFQIHTSDGTFSSGHVALYGEGNTVANFNNVLVRQYASADPTTTIGGLGSLQPLTIASVGFNPTSVFGGNASTGTVTLTYAPVSPVTVTLTTNNAAAILPTSVTIPGGSASATFVVNTIPVSAATPVTIGGSYNGNASATLTIKAPSVSSVSLSPASLTGGTSSTGTVTLAGQAPAGGAIVTLSSNNVAAAAVPASVTVPQGTTSATFAITTSPVSSTTSPIITATYSGSQTATLTVKSPVMAAVTLNPWSITGGSFSSGTVKLTGPAPAGGATVSLSSDNPSVATVPASTTVAAGQTTSSPFNITSSVVSASSLANISGTMGVQASASLAVNPSLSLASISISPTVTNGGVQLTGTVTLTSPAPSGGAVVPLSGTNDTVAFPDASTTVQAGATSASFSVYTNQATSASAVTFTGTYNGTQSTVLVVNPVGVSPLTIFPDFITPDSDSTNLPTSAGEYGVRFYSYTDGYILGVRFYKGTLSTGTHVGNLWSASGQLLATATFTGETASGWQQVYFSSPVHVTANTNYIASYYNPAGEYSATSGYFSLGAGIDSSPLEIPADSTNTPNGVYAYGATSSFPSNTLNSTNYWVDVIFDPTPTSVTVATTGLTDGFQTGFYDQTVGAAGGQQPYAWTVVSGSLPAGLTLSPSGLLSGTITASGSFNFTVQVTDSESPAHTARANLGLYVAPSDSCPCTVFPDFITPSQPDSGQNTPGEFGVRFTADADGYVTGIRFYKGSGNTGTHVGNLWTNSGQLMGSVTFTNETASGWQVASFSNPIHITANTMYVASYYSPNGDISATANYYSVGASIDSAPLYVPANGTNTPNGVYLYGASSAFPTNTNQSTNYWADLVFTASPDPLISSITLNPTSVVGGVNSTGTVTLSGAAPSGGEGVNLSSSDPQVASVPGTVTVPQGATSVNFAVTTYPVGDTGNIVITASGNGLQSGSLTVTTPVASSVTVSPSTINATYASTGTVTLNVVAPVGGTPVTLSSDNAAVTVPASVTVPGGSSSVTFGISTSSVGTTTTATISATAGATVTTTLTVNPFALAIQSVSVNPLSVTGGSSSTGTAKLNGPAPFGGTTVTLSSSDPTATVPASVVVPAGASSATFAITTSAVTNTVLATISATMNGTQTTVLTITDPPVTSAIVSLNPNSVTGGTSTTGSVTLNAEAPAGGIVVALSSNNAAASVPSSITVPTGATKANFTVTTGAVASVTTPTITATFNGTSTAQLIVNPPAIQSVSVNPTSVIGGSSNSTGTVTLNGPAPAGGISVALTNSNTSAVTMPLSVVVVAGATTATFTATSQVVTSQAIVTITAVLNSSQTTTLTVIPAATTISNFTLSPTSTIGGVSGVNSTGTITLNAAATGSGVTVTLSSSNTSVATVPSSVTVPANSISATFTVTPLAVRTSTNVTITAAFGGNHTATLTVQPPVVSSISLSPTSVTGGLSNSTGTVTLSGPAATGGDSVALSSDNTAAATVPSSVTVAAGKTTATFTVTGHAVAATSKANISGTFGVTQKTALTVNPPAVSSVTLNPTTVIGNTSSKGTVQLNAAAPTGGLTVTLASSNTSAATVPASLTVAAGAKSATFTVTTKPVSAQATPSISAAAGGATVSATLTVNPPTLTKLTLSSTSVTHPASSTGTVTISGVAPAAGFVVKLSSSNTSVATVPATVTIPSGATSVQFTVKTLAKAPGNGQVTITASATGSTNQTVQLTVK